MEHWGITRIAKLKSDIHSDETIHANPLIALPRTVDGHVRDMRLEYKETFQTRSQVAVPSGGIRGKAGYTIVSGCIVRQNGKVVDAPVIRILRSDNQCSSS